MDSPHEIRRPGRRPRGERHTVMPSFPIEHWEWYKRQADARGLLFSEYVCAELARAHSLDLPDYIRDTIVIAPVHELLPLDSLSGKTKRGTVRVPTSHFRHYKEQARQQEIPLADYVRRSLAARNGLDPVDLYEGRHLYSQSA